MQATTESAEGASLWPPEIASVLAHLSEQRPIFHSEADFQHALTWELHKQLPRADVRLEFPRAHPGKSLHVDVWITHPGGVLALELKYKTRRLSAVIGVEVFELLDQSAQDIARYDYVKDIQRLEQLRLETPDMVGSAILLTNDSSYWLEPSKADCVDAAFRLSEGRVLEGGLAWDPRAGRGTTRGREEALVITGRYAVRWHDYSVPGSGRYGRFRYMAAQIP